MLARPQHLGHHRLQGVGDVIGGDDGEQRREEPREAVPHREPLPPDHPFWAHPNVSIKLIAPRWLASMRIDDSFTVLIDDWPALENACKLNRWIESFFDQCLRDRSQIDSERVLDP